MKVLHLPINIASQISTTVRALQDIGVNARGLALNSSPIVSDEGLESYSAIPGRHYPILGRMHPLSWYRKVFQAMQWADVINWHGGDMTRMTKLLLKYITFLPKARIVHFWGSDVRIADIASFDNPYVAHMYEQMPDAARNSREDSRWRQALFSRYGFDCIVPGFELDAYIFEGLFPNPYNVNVGLILSDFLPKYPDPEERSPLIVHCPSNKLIKGTGVVLDAIDQLSGTHKFRFKLIHGVEHSEALAVMRDCDIMLDQFTIGDHGLAAVEAMAFGKPTVCYIKPSVVPKYPRDFPIVNANQENLAEVLKGLLEDGKQRSEIGRRSRAYVEKYHDAHKLAKVLVRIYEEVLEKVGKI